MVFVSFRAIYRLALQLKHQRMTTSNLVDIAYTVSKSCLSCLYVMVFNTVLKLDFYIFKHVSVLICLNMRGIIRKSLISSLSQNLENNLKWDMSI